MAARLTVEVADNTKTRARGLMSRPSLSVSSGMLFVFDWPQTLSFWMRDTEIPLSVAYIDQDWVITEIRDLEPFELTSVVSSAPCQYAIETNQGWFEQHLVYVGDRVVWDTRSTVNFLPAEKIAASYDDSRCQRCDKPLRGKTQWLELDTRDNKFYESGTVPPEFSQGAFEFGTDCAKHPNDPLPSKTSEKIINDEYAEAIAAWQGGAAGAMQNAEPKLIDMYSKYGKPFSGTLYRGANGRLYEVCKNQGVGGIVTIGGVDGFSTSKGIAKAWREYGFVGGKTVSVLFVLEGVQKTCCLNDFFVSDYYADDKEYLVGGTLRIKSIRENDGDLTVHVEQVSTSANPIGKTADAFHDRLGRCYELAGRYAIQHDLPDMTVVHGSIQGGGNPRISHAWVEYTEQVDRFVVSYSYDPVSDIELPTDAFERMFSSIPEHKYPRLQAMTMTTKSGNWGPWETMKQADYEFVEKDWHVALFIIDDDTTARHVDTFNVRAERQAMAVQAAYDAAAKKYEGKRVTFEFKTMGLGKTAQTDLHISNVWSDQVGEEYKAKFAADKDGVSVGFIDITILNNETYIDYIEVKPEFRRQDIATALVDFVMATEGAGTKLYWGMTTDEGALFKAHYKTAVVTGLTEEENDILHLRYGGFIFPSRDYSSDAVVHIIRHDSKRTLCGLKNPLYTSEMGISPSSATCPKCLDKVKAVLEAETPIKQSRVAGFDAARLQIIDGDSKFHNPDDDRGFRMQLDDSISQVLQKLPQAVYKKVGDAKFVFSRTMQLSKMEEFGMRSNGDNLIISGQIPKGNFSWNDFQWALAHELGHSYLYRCGWETGDVAEEIQSLKDLFEQNGVGDVTEIINKRWGDPEWISDVKSIFSEQFSDALARKVIGQNSYWTKMFGDITQQYQKDFVDQL